MVRSDFQPWFSGSKSAEISSLGFHNQNIVDLIETDSRETKRILQVISEDKKKPGSIQLQKVNGPAGWDLNTTRRWSNYHLNETQRKWHFQVLSYRLNSPIQVSWWSRAFLITCEQVWGTAVKCWEWFQNELSLLRDSAETGTTISTRRNMEKNCKKKVFPAFMSFCVCFLFGAPLCAGLLLHCPLSLVICGLFYFLYIKSHEAIWCDFIFEL